MNVSTASPSGQVSLLAEDDPLREYGREFAKVYDDLYKESGKPVAEFFSRRLPLGSALLEFGAGTGRLAIPLAEEGFRVTAIDISPEMLAIAKEKWSARLASEPAHSDPQGELRLLLGDMRTYHDHVTSPASTSENVGPYDVVLVGFNTIFHLLTEAEQRQCIRNAVTNLTAEGQLVVEMSSPDRVLPDHPFELRVRHQSDRATTLRSAIRWPLGRRVRGAHFRIPLLRRLRHPFRAIKELDIRTFQHRAITVNDLDLFANIAGLKLVERFGGWKDEPFTARYTNSVSVYQRAYAVTNPPLSGPF